MCRGTGTNPYRNIALERYLLEHLRDGECILYLWQNQRTVVIGRNQNPWKECRTELLRRDGGYLARRLSGGGAVFHDLGNLNFTFLANRQDYDVERQLQVLVEAVGCFGLTAQLSGRNDVTLDGKKFSGNAFYQTGNGCCHHGTILLHTDTESMVRYLNVSEEKLRSKGVDSVRSRVANLTDYLPDMNVEAMECAMLEAFQKIYGGTAPEIPEERLDGEELAKLERFHASWEWNYGRKIRFQVERTRKFPWGEVQILLSLNAGKVEECAAYGDALDTAFLPRLAEALRGIRWEGEELERAVEQLACEDKGQEQMKRDLTAWAKEWTTS